MVTAVGTSKNCISEISDGKHTIYADAVVEKGGEDAYMRPGNLLASAYAGCMNVTTRRILRDNHLEFEKVVVNVELDHTDDGKTIFQSKIEIVGDIPEAEKRRIQKLARNCAVCEMLKGEKEFHICDED